MTFKKDSTRVYQQNRGMFVRHVGVRLSESLADHLIEYANSVGKPPSVVARIAIGEFLHRHRKIRVIGESMTPWIIPDDKEEKAR